MELIDAIKTRRSIRKFTDKKIQKDTIEKVIDIATYAPSWKNTQTTHYCVILNAELKNKISEEGVMNFAWNQKTIFGAPALVIVTTEEGISGYEKDGAFSTSKGAHWESFDAGIATQTFCLAAHELGLGTVILGIFDEDKVKEMANIQKGRSVSALIAIGYPDQQPQAPCRKDVDELVTFIK